MRPVLNESLGSGQGHHNIYFEDRRYNESLMSPRACDVTPDNNSELRFGCISSIMIMIQNLPIRNI